MTIKRDLSNNWRKVRLGEICKIVSGSTPKTSEPLYWSGEIGWVTPYDLSKLKDKYISNGNRNITKLGLKNCSAELLPVNSLIMSSRAPIGYFAINKKPVATNQGCKSFVCDNSIDTEFLYYSLNEVIDSIKKVGSGSTFAEVGKSNLEKITISVPQKSIQQKIASILSTIDETIHKTDQIIEKTQKLKEGIMQGILSFGNDDHVRYLALGDIGKVSMCKRIFKNETSETGDIPFYKIGTFGKEPDSFISQILYDTYHKKYPFPKIGDVLLSASGTIGRKVKYDGRPAYFQDSNIIWLEHDEGKVLNDFLFYLYDTIRWQTEGSTIKRLYNSILLKKIIPVPSIEKQREICNVMGSLDSKLDVENKYREELIKIKSGLMNDIFSQKVEVTA